MVESMAAASLDILHPCNQCEKEFKSENGLKIHFGKAHNSQKIVASIAATSLDILPHHCTDHFKVQPV